MLLSSRTMPEDRNGEKAAYLIVMSLALTFDEGIFKVSGDLAEKSCIGLAHPTHSEPKIGPRPVAHAYIINICLGPTLKCHPINSWIAGLPS